jgi:hypothetical protein
MTARTLQRLANRYKRLLKIDEWKIKAIFGNAAKESRSSEDKYEVYGCCVTNHERHKVAIIIACPTEEMHRTTKEIAYTVVHEILHPTLDPAGTMMNDAVFEMGLDRLSKLIVDMDYANRALKQK